MTTPSTTTRRHWREFWATKASPLHADETETGYRSLADELRLLFPGSAVRRVLEIGCGNGAMFEPLGFHRAEKYLGIDFSPAMLDEFRARFPTVDLAEGDATTFRTTRTFDLIFSSHVVQYWDRRQLADHLENARAMIADDGYVVITGFPWRRMRLAQARGDLNGGDLIGSGRQSLPVAALNLLRELLLPRIGHWYDFPELERLAAAHRFSVTFRGSGYYPYRFHAILEPVAQLS